MEKKTLFCDNCGNQIKRYAKAIRSDLSFCSKDCSNQRRDKKINNFIGKIFTYLEVVSFSHVDKNSSQIFICKCKCGKMKKVRKSLLNDKTVKSCGCLHKERAYDLSQDKIIQQEKRETVLCREVPNKNTTTGVKNVYIAGKNKDKYTVTFFKNGKKMYFGWFDTLNEAKEKASKQRKIFKMEFDLKKNA